jgi:hypothetical protein
MLQALEYRRPLLSSDFIELFFMRVSEEVPLIKETGFYIMTLKIVFEYFSNRK